MADEPSEAALSDARLILAGAVAAAGPRGDSSIGWKGRVNASIIEVAAMFGRGSPQLKRVLAMQSANVFSTEYIGYNTEYLTDKDQPDKSTRLQVELKHAKDHRHEDGVQRIRTERTDTPAGKAMENRLKQIKAGATVLCWRVMEPMSTGDAMAVLYHIEEIATPSSRPSTAAQPDPEGSPAPSSAPSGSTSPEMQAMKANTPSWMTPEQKEAFVERMKTKGLWPASPTNIDAILLELRAEEEPF